MRAAIALRDVVGEAQDVFVIAVIPFQRDFNGNAIALPGNRNGIGKEWCLGAIQPFHKGGNPTFIIQLNFLLFGMARVDQEQANARVQKGEFAKAMLQLVKIKLGDLERVWAWQEGHARAALGPTPIIIARRADDLERRHGIAMLKLHIMLLPIAPDRQVEPDRQRVDNGHANAVQAARHLIGIVVGRVFKLPACVQLRHDDFGGRHAFFGVNIGWDAAPIILNRDRSIGIELDDHPVAMAGQRLVNRIIRDLKHHMVQARTIIGIANIHARALTHRIKAFENLDRVSAIVVGIRDICDFVCHGQSIGKGAP